MIHAIGQTLRAIQSGIRGGIARFRLAIEVPQLGECDKGIQESRRSRVACLGRVIGRSAEIGLCQCGPVFMEKHRRKRDSLLVESSTGARRMLSM